MAASPLASSPPTLRQLTVPSAVLLLVAAAAWLGVLVLARGMAGMTGAMGLSLLGFVPVWALMMTAMMLPTVTPFAGLYTRTFADRRLRRTVELGAGYLLVWVAAGVPAYGLAWLTGTLLDRHPGAGIPVAVVVLAGCGVYQLSPAKEWCLARCRSPLGAILRYGSYQGRWRDVRVGLHHGAVCLGCCWALMTVLLAVGLMNAAAMVVLSAVVLAEKTWRRAGALRVGLGVAALLLAVGVLVHPAVATGLHLKPEAPMPPAPMSGS